MRKDYLITKSYDILLDAIFSIKEQMMIKVTREIIDQCAENLMFHLTDDEIEMIYDDFDSVLVQIDFLKSIKDVDTYEPMTFPYKEHQKVMRDDKPSKPLSAKDALKNSKTVLGTQIKLPKVVGNKNDTIDE